MSEKTVKERLGVVETKVDEIATNHLPHIDAKIDKITWFLLTTLATGLVSLALLFFRK